MINLLNPSEVSELRAARINVRLRRLTVLTFVGIGIICGIYAFSFYTASKSYSEAVAKSSATDASLKNFESVKIQAKQYQTNLNIAKKILGSEVTFSSFITELAGALPPNTVLESLALSTKSIGTVSGKAITTELVAKAKGYNDVIALKTSLEQKTTLFSAVRISSTSLTDLSTTTDPLTRVYPYTVNFSVVIAPQGGVK
jgi:Tfp pilus assembly protein PilN